MNILIDAVNQLRHVVAANVTTRTGTHHRLGHLPTEGWFCCCNLGKRCPQIAHVKALVPPMETR
ncbi:MAG: hypothetical protein ACRDQH_02480 [Pseudonocardiaceae bacterium]